MRQKEGKGAFLVQSLAEVFIWSHLQMKS